MTRRPDTSEYNEWFAGYVERAEDDPLAQLEAQVRLFERTASLPEGDASRRPTAEEWSLKEILVHLCDFERMFAYRALRFSRGDETPVEAFEQDPYVAASRANGRTLGDIVAELVALRRATVMLFRSFSEEMLDRSGVAGGNRITVRALVCIVPGHSAGHLADVERMFPSVPAGE